MLFVNDLVYGVDVSADGSTDDIGGDTVTGVELALEAKLYECVTHSLLALGNGADLEVVKLVAVSDDLLDGNEGGIDGTVAYGDSEK